MRLTADRDGSSRRFSAKLGWKDRFDPKEMQILSAGAIPMLIPPVSIQGRRNNVIQYDISDYSTLEFYLSCILSREQFAELLLQCLDVFQRMQQICLNYKNLVLDLDKVYIQLGDRSVHFIYLPLAATKREESMQAFFCSILTKTVRSTYEQSAFLDACLTWLNQPVPFIPAEFADFIRENAFLHTACAVQQSGRAEADEYASALERRTVAPVPREVRETERENPLHGSTTQLSGFEGGTVLLGESEISEKRPRYYIRRVQTEELIELTHFPLLVGTEVGSVAYCVVGNHAVSRRHAEFSLMDGECVISDQKSTNKTYINDCALIPFTPQPLKDGDEIRMGNERFWFIREEQP